MSLKPMSVNDALASLDEFANQDIAVCGLFWFEFEDVSLSHLPSSEQADGYASSLWLSVGSGSLSFDEAACRKLHRRTVVVEGTLLKGPSGHMSLWPAELRARTLRSA